MLVMTKEEKEAVKNWTVSQGWNHEFDCVEMFKK